MSSSRCGSCGEPTRPEDRYCEACGLRQPEPRDHVEIDLGVVAGVTDRGRRHERNEDAMALARLDGAAVVVVCDGVSTTVAPELASQAAVDAAVASLTTAVSSGSDPASAVRDAARRAQDAVLALRVDAPVDASPSCTFVAAILVPATGADGADAVDLTVGWLGDSRAYWLGADPVCLTTDHNWGNELRARGATAADVAAEPRAAVLTRWLGRDAPSVDPQVVRARLTGPGHLLVCSDGLWNYAPEAVTLHRHPAMGRPTVLDRAAALTAFALEGGGHDNITVALASCPPAAGPLATGDGAAS